jgi:hypothetical protein
MNRTLTTALLTAMLTVAPARPSAALSRLVEVLPENIADVGLPIQLTYDRLGNVIAFQVTAQVEPDHSDGALYSWNGILGCRDQRQVEFKPTPSGNSRIWNFKVRSDQLRDATFTLGWCVRSVPSCDGWRLHLNNFVREEDAHPFAWIEFGIGAASGMAALGATVLGFRMRRRRGSGSELGKGQARGG